MSTTKEVLLLIIITLISPSFSSGFGINLMEVPAEDHSQVICTTALLKKYFHYGVPLSGSLLSMSITSAAIQIQQSLLRAIHTDETYPWSVIVKHARHETPITSPMLVVHEKPQCYFVVIENLEDEDLEDMFEDWRTTINWNPLAQFVVYLASVEETDEEMTELMIEILLYFMNIKIYNVNVIGQNEENGFYYGKTVFPYHPDNNCGNRVIAIETLDICDYHETSRDEEEDEETDDYDEGEQDTDENEEGTEDGEDGEDDNENGADDNEGGVDDDGEGADDKEDDDENGEDGNEKGKDDNGEGVGDDGEGEGVNEDGIDDKKDGEDNNENGEDDNEKGTDDNEGGAGDDGENGADDNKNGAGEDKKGTDDDEEGVVVNEKGVDDESGAEDNGGGEDDDGADDNENGAGDDEEAKDDNEKGTDVNEKGEYGKNEAGNAKKENTNDIEDGGKDIEKDYNEVVADVNEEGGNENQEDGDDNEENLDDNEADVNEYKQVKRNVFSEDASKTITQNKVANNDNNPNKNNDHEIQSNDVKTNYNIQNERYKPVTKRKKSQNTRKRRKRQMSATERTEEKHNATEPTTKIYLEELYRALFLDKFPKDLSGCPLVAAYRPYEPYIFSEDYTKNDENYEDTEYTEASNTDTDEYAGNDAYTDENTHGSKLTGIEYKMIQTIAERLHITIDIQVDNKNLYHLFQQLIDGDVEMVVGGVDEDPSISQYVSSTIPYHQDDLTWCVAKAKQSHNLFNFLTSFRMETWALTLTFVLASALAITFIQKTLKVKISNLQGYFTVATLIYGVILSQAMQLKRSPSALKICLGTAFFMSLMFSNIYQSFLISTLTTPKNSYQISHLHEIYSNRMSIMGSVDNVRHLNKDGEIFKYIREKFQMCYDIEECLIRAANDDRIAVAVSRQHTFYNPRIPRDQLYCFNRDENIYVYLVTLLLPKKFHLLHRINPIIQHVIESGHMQKWARDLDMKRKIKEEVNRVREEPVKKITLSQVGGIFVFGAILLVFAFLVFVAECWVHWMVSKRRTRLKLAKILHKHFK